MKLGKKNKNDSAKRKTGPKHAKFNVKRYFIILGVFLIVALGIGAMCMGLNHSKNEDMSEESSIAQVDLKKEGKINFLLLGVDVEGLRTDAMMIASYDVKEGKVNMLSIPRDTRMYVGTKYQKINAAHAIGGMTGKIAGPEGSIEAVTRLTGIPIHYYVEFSFNAIDNFIDALGGVDFDVPDIEGNGKGMNYDDPVQNLHIHLKPGQQHLTGNQVQQLLRYRKSNTKGVGYADGDRGRVGMQQDFVKTLVEQKLTPSLILKVPELYEQLTKDIKTNLTLSDVTKYAGYLKDFKSENITAYQLPGTNNGTDYGASYWICNLDETKTLVESVFGYDASKITIDSPDGSSKSKDKKNNSSSSSSKKDTKETDIPDNDEDDDVPLKQANKTPSPSKTPKATVSASPSTSPKAEEKNDDEKSTAKPNSSEKPASEETTATETENKDKTENTDKTEATKEPVKEEVKSETETAAATTVEDKETTAEKK